MSAFNKSVGLAELDLMEAANHVHPPTEHRCSARSMRGAGLCVVYRALQAYP